MDIKIIREQQIFNNKSFHLFVYNKTESITGLHQHDYYEYTLVLTGRYYQRINGKQVFLERGDVVFIPKGSSHESFYDFGATKILNVGISKSLFEQYYLSLLPTCFVASQAYPITHEFLSYIESVIASSTFRENEYPEFLETVTFHVLNRLRHYQNQQQDNEDIPAWLQTTIKVMHDKNMFGENALLNMIKTSGKSQEYLTRVVQHHYHKTPMQIINEIRINFAKTQLEVSTDSVTDIAFESGYSDVSLFIKNFKKLTSFTPGYYRKKSCNLCLITSE